MNELVSQIEFKGFEPDEGLRGKFREVFDRIMGSAPSDATPVASLKKIGERFEGFVQLKSQQGTFVARVLTENPFEALQSLNERIFEQIISWRGARNLFLGRDS